MWASSMPLLRSAACAEAAAVPARAIAPPDRIAHQPYGIFEGSDLYGHNRFTGIDGSDVNLLTLCVVKDGGAARVRLAERGLCHCFKSRQADERTLQGEPQAAHKGVTDTLAGERAGTDGDGQPVQCNKIEPCHHHCFANHRRESFRMTAFHGLPTMGADGFVIQNGGGTGAERRVDSENLQRRSGRRSRSNNPAGLVE
jgi:hypothetical protein